jgi:hypothetical protein
MAEYVIAKSNSAEDIKQAWVELGAKVFGQEYEKESPVASYTVVITESDMQAIRDGGVIVVGVADMEYTLHIRTEGK